MFDSYDSILAVLRVAAGVVSTLKASRRRDASAEPQAGRRSRVLLGLDFSDRRRRHGGGAQS